MEENNNIVNNESNKNNSKKFINTILVVVAFLVCFSIGYLIGTNAFGGDNGKNENKKEEKETNDNVEKPTFDINALYYNLHVTKDETDIQIGLEKSIYNHDEVYVKDFTGKELYLILDKQAREKIKEYYVKDSGPSQDANGNTVDPGYDTLIEYEPAQKIFKETLYKIAGDNLTFKDDLLYAVNEVNNVHAGFHYDVKEIDGKKYYAFSQRTGSASGSPYYKYTYEKTEEKNDEVYVYEKVQIVDYGETNPIASYTYKWTYKIGNDNQYHLYKINRE